MAANSENGQRRGQVLRALTRAIGPVGVAELAQELEVHPNTVRFHLDALERSGVVERVHVDPVGRGRPRIRYQRVAPPTTGERRYELLADVLAGGLASADHGRDIAVQAGHTWGLAHARSTDHAGEDAVDDLLSLLDDVGFAPRRTGLDAVELLNCPFSSVVAAHGELVCGLHLGLVRGALAGWNASVEAASLEPMVSPGVCRLTLSATEPPQAT